MQFDELRSASWTEAVGLGYPANSSLPLLDASAQLRDFDEVVARFVTLNAVVSTAFGYDRSEAIEWLKRSQLELELSPSEREFLKLDASQAQKNAMQWQVETLWTFAWMLNLHDSMDFSEVCGDHLITMVPDLKNDESIENYLPKLSLREQSEVLKACDLGYCLHWGQREFALNGRVMPNAVPERVILERRRALDWSVSDLAWDDIELDT